MAHEVRRALIRPRRHELRLDRATVGLAIGTVGVVSTVLGSEAIRLLRRRARSAHRPQGLIDTTSQTTRDTVAVARSGLVEAPTSEASMVAMTSGFVISFAIARLSTLGISHGKPGPWGNLVIRGRHIHHFVPGILLAFLSGGVALVTRNEDIEPWLALPFGVGLGLTFDEAALLLELDDVYWSQKGVVSVQLSLGTAALLSATVLVLRVIRRGERTAAVEGGIPDETGTFWS